MAWNSENSEIVILSDFTFFVDECKIHNSGQQGKNNAYHNVDDKVENQGTYE